MTDHELRVLINKDLNAGAQALYQQYGRYVYAIRTVGIEKFFRKYCKDRYSKLYKVRKYDVILNGRLP